jgi:hypothetical protein
VSPERRSQWLNGALVVAAIAITAVVVVTSSSVSTGERQARARHLLASFRQEDVTQLSIDKDGQRWVVVKSKTQTDAHADSASDSTGPDNPRLEQPARWQFVEPMQGDAEEATIDQLLRVVQFATWLRPLKDADVDREAFGLETPRAVISVEMGDVQYRLRLGAPAVSPAGAHYVEVSGEGAPNKGVYVVAESTAGDLDPDPEDLRIRQLIPYAGSALRAIGASIGQERVKLVRVNRDSFRFEQRFERARIGRDALDRILLGFSRTQAERFLPIERATQLQLALGDGLLRLELEPRGDAPPARITLGGACPEVDSLVLAVRHAPRPSAACITKTQLTELFASPEWLVDRELFHLRVDEAERVTVTQGERRMELVRTGDAFEMRHPTPGKVDRAPAEERIELMLAIRGDLVTAPDPLQLGLGESDHRVVFVAATSDLEGAEETVEVGRPMPDGTLHARRLADGVVLRLGPAATRAFEADGLLLRSRQLLDLSAAQVRTVEVDHAGTRWRLEQPSQGRFELSEPQGVAPDTSLAVAWVDAVRQLAAQRWVAETDDGGFGLTSPGLTFRVAGEDGSVARVRVGAKTSQGFFAAVDSQPGVFVLPRNVVETLTTFVLDRSGFDLDPDTVSDLAIESGGSRIELARVGRELVQKSGGVRFDPNQIQELVDALGLVRPEAAIGFDPEGERYGFDHPVLDVSFTFTVGAERHRRHWQVGSADSHRSMSVHMARLVGERAVFVIPRRLITRVLDLL